MPSHFDARHVRRAFARAANSYDAAAITACATLLGFSTGHTIQVDGGRAL